MKDKQQIENKLSKLANQNFNDVSNPKILEGFVAGLKWVLKTEQVKDNIEANCKKWFIERFGEKKLEQDPTYFQDWVEIFRAGNPITKMDHNSENIYNKLKEAGEFE